ncbi:hypothetical protein niasHS_005974 [Heterodera schachtii]|uniref:polynucleotide adenylyltransferase n=1 Tax=Heterodera schachtii TaxID=97005 RepID=A0ABD2JN24_HETSC
MEENEEKTTENLKKKKEIGEEEENIGENLEKEEKTEEKEVKTEENFEREEKFEDSEEKGAENLEKLKLKEKVSKQEDFETANGTKLKKNDGQFAKSANSSPEKLDVNEFAFIKLGDFEDDQFLALKYGEFLGILSRNEDGEKARKAWSTALKQIEEKENLAKCAAIEQSLAHLLDIGILANEIWHYVQTMKALNGKSKDLAKFEKEWAQLKQLKLEEEISTKNLEQKLFTLLKRIVVEGIAAENAQNLKLEMNGEIGQENLKEKSDQIIEIKNCLTTNGYLSEEEMHKKGQIMGELTKIVKGWWPDTIIQFAKLVLGNEKLETICILSDQFDRDLIVGELNCEMYERQKCTDSSLYCIICKHSAVKSLVNANSSALPKLEFLFMDVPIEMTFIFVPNDKLSIPKEQNNLSNYEKFANYFAENIEKLAFNDNFDDKMNKDEIDLLEEFLEKSTFRNQFEMDNVLEDKKQLEKIKEKALKERQNLEEQKAMLMTLSKNLMNERIFEILSSEQKLEKNYSEKKLLEVGKNNEKLRIVLSFLELWTKNNFIYGPEIGYLNTPMLLIMVSKVFLFFPEASVPFLIEKFFLIYSKWKWPIPVQLAQIEHQKNAEFLVWSPGREWFTKKQFGSGKISETMAMPIISPLFPEQNEAYRINLSTAKVIQNELKSAFVQIRNIDETRQIIEPILGNKKFTEKYEHFVTFVCAGNEWNVQKFCHFVGKRLGHELLHFVEQSPANLINFCHIYPKVVLEKQLSEDKKWKNLQKRIWLVGLKLQKQKKRNDEAFTSELKAVLSSKLAEIDAKIKSDFEGKRYYNVRLNSEFVERSELDNLANF